jgi:putative ABC transport system ATP-binding protein
VGTGWPLSITETLQLKLAAAIIARPRVLVLSQAFDAMPEVHQLRAMNDLQKRCQTTVVCFTYENTDLRFDRYLHLGHEKQTMTTSYEELCAAMGLAEHPMRPPVTIYGESNAEFERDA